MTVTTYTTAATTPTTATAPPSACRVTQRQVSGRADLALVYLLQLGADPQRLVETVDSIDPRFARADKSVIIISTQLGCPVGCLMCDAGDGGYRGDLTADEMLAQVRFVVARRPEILAARKLKLHFARMGEPALNPAVLGALARLPEELPAAGLLPCISSVCPERGRLFFEQLLRLRQERYAGRGFQLQLSINTTDPELRRRLMPIPLLSLAEVARIGQRFHQRGERRPVLNFALARGLPLSAAELSRTFDPRHFVLKLTPVNPTERALRNGLDTALDAAHPDAAAATVAALQDAGYEVIVSIGEPDEIAIGSNCGQLAARAWRTPDRLAGGA